jgi:hypothetical protein
MCWVFGAVVHLDIRNRIHAQLTQPADRERQQALPCGTRISCDDIKQKFTYICYVGNVRQKRAMQYCSPCQQAHVLHCIVMTVNDS